MLARRAMLAALRRDVTLDADVAPKVEECERAVAGTATPLTDDGRQITNPESEPTSNFRRHLSLPFDMIPTIVRTRVKTILFAANVVALVAVATVYVLSYVVGYTLFVYDGGRCWMVDTLRGEISVWTGPALGSLTQVGCGVPGTRSVTA